MSTRTLVKSSFVELASSGRLVKSGTWLPFGEDDLKPQHLIAASRESGTLALCVATKAKFIEGNGCKDKTFYQAKINKRQKVDGLLRDLVKDLAQFEGFALLINYNALLQVASVQHLPFEKCRQCKPDAQDVVHNIAVVNRLDKYQQQHGLRKTQPEFYPVFNPDKAIVQAQIEAAEGLANYKGQILYYFHEKPGSRYYPSPLYEAVWEDIVTEVALKRSRKRDVKSGFSAKTMITLYGSESPTKEVREQDSKDYKEFTGEDGYSVLVQYAKNKDSKADIDPFQAPDVSQRYVTDEKAVKTNIKEIFQIPDVLYGTAVAGSLGLSTMVQDAIDYVIEHVVNTDQRAIEENFKLVFSNWREPICPSGDFSIHNFGTDLQSNEEQDKPDPFAEQIAKARAELRG